VSKVETLYEFAEMYVWREKWQRFLTMILPHMDTLTIRITPGSSIPVEFCVHCKRHLTLLLTTFAPSVQLSETLCGVGTLSATHPYEKS
jgi:hypothetical protein